MDIEQMEQVGKPTMEPYAFVVNDGDCWVIVRRLYPLQDTPWVVDVPGTDGTPFPDFAARDDAIAAAKQYVTTTHEVDELQRLLTEKTKERNALAGAARPPGP